MPRVLDYLQDLEHVSPPVVDSQGPTIGTDDPEPIPADTFPTSDTY